MSTKNKNYRKKDKKQLERYYDQDLEKQYKHNRQKGRKSRRNQHQGQRYEEQEDTLYADRINDYSYEDKNEKHYENPQRQYNRNWKHDRSQDQYQKDFKNPQKGGKHGRYKQKNTRYKFNQRQGKNRNGNEQYSNNELNLKKSQSYQHPNKNQKHGNRYNNKDQRNYQQNRGNRSTPYHEEMYEYQEIQRDPNSNNSEQHRENRPTRRKTNNNNNNNNNRKELKRSFTNNPQVSLKNMQQDMDTPRSTISAVSARSTKSRDSNKNLQKDKKNFSKKAAKIDQESEEPVIHEERDNRGKLKDKEYEILVQISHKNIRSFRVDIQSEDIEEKLENFCKKYDIDEDVTLFLKVYILQNIIFDHEASEYNNILNQLMDTYMKQYSQLVESKGKLQTH